MTNDIWGNPLSYTDAAAVQRLEQIQLKLASYQADPLTEITMLLQEHPGFLMGHLLRAAMIATAVDRAFEGEFKLSMAAAENLSGHANARERHYLAAMRAWGSGDTETGTELLGRASIAYPRDLSALQFAQAGDFFHGHSHMLRDRVTRVLPAWTERMPGYGFVKGMLSFGLEESGDYAAAEAAGREAVSLDSRDAWAVHAVAHVMEMQGRAEEGAVWLRQTMPGWRGGGLFSYHNFFHLALFEIEARRFDKALAAYDDGIAPGGFGQALELVDGSAVLWRLWALGADVGERWQALVAGWEARIDDGFYAFNDVHAAMAFAATERRDLIGRTVASLKRVAEGAGTNAMMAREIGLPACLGIAAFADERYEAAIDHLSPLRAKANRFGGSHAQRDIIAWTMTEAAIRSGDRRTADAMVAERLAWKPESPLNRDWALRASELTLKRAA